MIPREAGRGRSFMGAGQYYLHDKGAATAERVSFTHTENVPTDDPHKALKWMAWTAMNAEDLKRESGVTMNGQSCGKPVFTFSLAWHPEQQPQKHEMIGAGRTALETLGLAHHEVLMVSHTDREHPHLHVIVNVVDPETGKANRLSFSRKKLSEWAEGYEREHGKIYCDQRVENNARRQQGEYVKYREPEVNLKTQITELYQRSDNGAAFQASLAELGYTLAQGKRIVLVGPNGEIHSLSRQIEGAKAKDIRAKLGKLELPDVDAVRRLDAASTEQKPDGEQEADETPVSQPGAKEEPLRNLYEVFDREQQDRDWQESIVDAALEHERRTTSETDGPRDAESQSGGTGDSGLSKASGKRKQNLDQGLKPGAEKSPASESSRLKKLFPLPVRPPVSPYRINELQDRHHVEISRFYEENAKARSRLKATLDDQYGAHERELRYEADCLQSVLENSGPMRLWWLKLTKQIPPNAEEELINKQRTLENIEWRRQEARDTLEAAAAKSRRDIEIRQQSERQTFLTVLPTLHDVPSPDSKTDFEVDENDRGPTPEF